MFNYKAEVIGVWHALIFTFHISGGLGSYTPSKASPGLYQLGTYKEKLVDAGDGKKSEFSVSGDDNPAEEYLRPDTEKTTWSNEIGAADILF